MTRDAYEWISAMSGNLNQLREVQVNYDVARKDWVVTTHRRMSGYRYYRPTLTSLKRMFLKISERVQP